MTISFEEAAFGCEKTITLRNPNGTDQSTATQTLKVKIPAGIGDGQSVRLRGKGMPGNGGGEPGDLLLKVAIQEKPGFERKGMDVYTTVQLSLIHIWRSISRRYIGILRKKKSIRHLGESFKN